MPHSKPDAGAPPMRHRLSQSDDSEYSRTTAQSRISLNAPLVITIASSLPAARPPIPVLSRLPREHLRADHRGSDVSFGRYRLVLIERRQGGCGILPPFPFRSGPLSTSSNGFAKWRPTIVPQRERITCSIPRVSDYGMAVCANTHHNLRRLKFRNRNGWAGYPETLRCAKATIKYVLCSTTLAHKMLYNRLLGSTVVYGTMSQGSIIAPAHLRSRLCDTLHRAGEEAWVLAHCHLALW